MDFIGTSKNNRGGLIRMVWRDDDSIRFYLDTPDKRGVGELQIDNTWGVSGTVIVGNVRNVLIEL